MLSTIKEKKAFWVAASLVMGFLQAWDSGALQAEGFARVLIATGILLPAVAIGAPVGQGVRIAALLVAAVILVWARMIASTSLNGLHLALFVPALYILIVCRVQNAVVRQTEA